MSSLARRSQYTHRNDRHGRSTAAVRRGSRGLLEFETLISDLSSRFINLPPGDVDREIEGALSRVCELRGLDLAVLWQWSTSDPGVITPTHAYPAENRPKPLDTNAQAHYPWSVEAMRAGRRIVLSSLDDVPAEGAVDRESARLFGIKSNLTVPLVVGGEPPVGALALNTLRSERDWPDAVVRQLELVAQVFTNALARRRHEQSLKESKERLEAAADLAGLAFYEVDFGDRAVFVDDRFSEVCGIPPGTHQNLEALDYWIEHLHPDDREHVMAQREELHAGRQDRLSIEYRYLHPAHGEKWLHHAARVTRRDANGRTIRTFGVWLSRLITRREKPQDFEKALARTPDDIKVVIQFSEV